MINNKMDSLIYAKITGKYQKSFTVMVEDILYDIDGNMFIIYPSDNKDSYCEALPIEKKYHTKIIFYTK